jgi:hypothetical protein
MRLLLRRLIGTTGGRTVLAVTALILVYQVWLSLQAPGKIDDAFADESDPVDAQVTLRFQPERWHILQLQEHGRVTGTDGEVLELRRTTKDSVREIARYHWVARIEVLDAPSPAEEFRD